jgi:putative hydrolase of the HAD superfamily
MAGAMTISLAPAPVSQRVDFSAVRNWIFDLDNTLYPRRCNLFAQVDIRITHYVMAVTKLEFAPARALQKSFYRDYGTTLNGLMQRYEHFLRTVHAIDYTPVEADPALARAIGALPGRKFILTNGDVPHAHAVLARLDIEPTLFEVIHDVKAMQYRPKPEPSAYAGLLETCAIDPATAAMFDDLDKNLLVPHELGMETVHVVAGADFAHAQVEAWELEVTTGAHVHHRTDDLAAFLATLV